MSVTRPPHTAARAATAVTAAGLAAALGLGPAALPADATANASITRISGADRYATSAAVSAATFASAADVVIASGDVYPDGLSAAALAGQLRAPVLLVPALGPLPAPILAEIARLGASSAHLVGGPGAISGDTAGLLTAAGLLVRRYSGVDRYDTSRVIAAALTRIGTDDGLPTAFVVTGENGQWADALAASGPAFAATMPLVLTNGATLSASARATLTGRGIGRVLLVGATSTVTAEVEAEIGALGIEVRRFAGQTREATATALATYLTGDADFGFTDTGVVAVLGSDYADALSAGPHSGTTRTPIVFLEGTVPADTAAYLIARQATMGAVRLLGGPGALPETLVPALAAAAGGGLVWASEIVVGPDEFATINVQVDPPLESNTRTFLATGLTAGAVYRATLVNAANVSIDDAGMVTFAEDGTTGLALAGSDATQATIVSMGGATTDVGSTDTPVTRTATPLGGSIAVVVQGDDASSYYVVVHREGAPGNTGEGGSRPELEINAAGVPTEAFGITGRTTLLPLEAPGGVVPGTAAGSPLSLVDKEGDFLVGPGGTYYYDANDRFAVSGVPVTLAGFEAALSVGDGFSDAASSEGTGTYADVPELSSRFNLIDATPGPVTGVRAATVDADTVALTWAADPPARLSYRVYRKEGAGSPVLGDYTLVASVAAGRAAPRYTDEGLAAATGYAYAVTRVLDGDESALSDTGLSVDEVSTTAVGANDPPESTGIAVTTDAGFTGIAGAGDVWTLGFSRELLAADATDLIRVQDADGESYDFPAVSATVTARNTMPRSFQGTTYAAGTLLTYLVPEPDPAGLIDRDGAPGNNNGSLDYPLTVTNSSGVAALVAGLDTPWSPVGDPDDTLETGVAAPS